MVTTLPAKAGSFSGNALGTRIRWRLKTPPEPQDVPRGIDIPADHISAEETIVHPDRERLVVLRQSTARTTLLRGVLRVNRDALRTSLFRFLREDVEKLRPSHIVRALGALGKRCPGDPSDVQGLVDYCPVPLDQLASFLVVKPCGGSLCAGSPSSRTDGRGPHEPCNDD